MLKIKVFMLCIVLLNSFNIITKANGHEDAATCDEQLSQYRKFILQAILSFEDVCDTFTVNDNPHEFIRNYNPQDRTEVWAFFKLLMAQFHDPEFVNIIKEAIIGRCQTKILQDVKRDAVVLGKKQRFHSWGGKRSSLPWDGSTTDGRTMEKQLF